MADINKTYYCKTCGRTMDGDQFYASNRLDRYPDDGKLPECKKCITRHVDNWNPRTYLWILEEIDVPYIEDEWNKLLERYGKDRTKITGMTILGRYLSKMKLNQYNMYKWEDTEKIKAKAEAEKRDVMARQGYSGEEIEQAIAADFTPAKPIGMDEPTREEPAPIDAFEPVGFEDDLTEEDKIYLSIKWGKTYKPYEWVQLEKYYQEMMQSFDIQTPSHEDYLKLICKTSIKAHQLIDLGDIEGFQKMSKVYDALMKSAKFTAVQNKAESGEFVNSISELVLLCEKEEATVIKDSNNPFTIINKCPVCGTLIMEPVYRRKLELYLEMHENGENYQRILTKMKEIINNNKCVVFVDEIDNSFTEMEAIYIEFRDVLDLCQIDVNDISRGSDYGD